MSLKIKKLIYEPKLKSVRKHPVPKWFHDAKFGIFIHWSLSSVPAFAVVGQGDLNEIQRREGAGAQFVKNPYAEWYLNSLRIKGSKTQQYHNKTYGKNFSYDDFVPMFNEAIKKWDPNEWVELFKKSGARYVVLVTKHHDGFILWPSKFKNPRKKNYHAKRDIVGELTNSVEKAGLKMGLYYSSALDWSFNEDPITDIASILNNGSTDPEYIEYVNNHWYELIDQYKPLILWSDINYPPKTNVYELFAYYYNKIPNGVVNDRWSQIPIFIQRALNFRPIKLIVNWLANLIIAKGSAPLSKPPHCDFQTPEYTSFDKVKKKKWECVRGIGLSFGYNKFEPKNQYLTLEELIYMFVDIVSKNGNLLLNVGPMSNGTIPDIQKNLLLKFGEWLEMNGDAIFGTRPWKKAEGQTSDNIEVRFTQKDNALYVILLGKPKVNKLVIESVDVKKDSKIQILGLVINLNWSKKNGNLIIELPEVLSDAPAYSFKINPKPND